MMNLLALVVSGDPPHCMGVAVTICNLFVKQAWTNHSWKPVGWEVKQPAKVPLETLPVLISQPEGIQGSNHC